MFKYGFVVAVFAIVFQVPPPFIEDSQRVTEPVWPDNVNVPELLPRQTKSELATVPPTEAVLTVNVETDDVAVPAALLY